MKTTLLVLVGDTIEKKQTIPDDQGRFIFIVIGEKIFYLNTAIGEMWETTKEEMHKFLGEGHQRVLGEVFDV